MPTYTYNPNIPAANNAPRNDQPIMQQNAASISSIIAVDHVGFNIINGGAHKQTQLLNVSGGNGTIPTGLLGNGYETIYSSATSGSGDLWFVRGASPTGIRLTGPGTPAKQANGSTFLPGGLILNWGMSTVALKGTSTPITFNQAFSTAVYSITIGCINTQGDTPSSNNVYVKSGTASITGFTVTNSSSGGLTEIYWMAIGA